jgi:hypothetical protein
MMQPVPKRIRNLRSGFVLCQPSIAVVDVKVARTHVPQRTALVPDALQTSGSCSGSAPPETSRHESARRPESQRRHRPHEQRGGQQTEFATVTTALGESGVVWRGDVAPYLDTRRSSASGPVELGTMLFLEPFWLPPTLGGPQARLALLQT